MEKKPFIILAISALILASLGCRVTMNLPVQKVSTGTMQTETIRIAPLDADMVDLNLEFGAGELTLTPGDEAYLVTGQAKYNIEEFKPITRIEGNRAHLETGSYAIRGLPDFRNIDNVKNQWDLALSPKPMNLSIRAGGYKGSYEFGGLSLKNLEISDGASEVILRFSNSNLIEMNSLRYTTGASKVGLYGLGYAGFSSLVFKGGAGDYTLDFRGVNLRDSNATIEAGISQVTLIVPEGIIARVILKSGLLTTNTTGDWNKNDDQYTLDGKGPIWTINIEMGVGTLNLETRK